jgi:hypothetical protein
MHRPEKQKKDDRQLYRKQLLVENAVIFASTLVFTKLVLFTRYPLLNLPIKFSLFYLYSATLDPLVIFSGYKLTRFMQQVKEESQ